MTTGCWQVLADVGAGPAGGVRGQGYHPNTRGGSLEGLMFDRSDKGFGYTTQRWPGWPVPSYLIQTTGLTIQLGCWLSVHLVFFSWKFFSEDVRLATYTMSSCPYNGCTSDIQARFLTDLYLPDAVVVALMKDLRESSQQRYLPDSESQVADYSTAGRWTGQWCLSCFLTSGILTENTK